MIKQGEIYLANFGNRYNSEIGKVRPAVVLQSDFFNRAIKSQVYKQVLVAPLSTLPIEDDYRLLIKARDRLNKDSYIIANWLCTLDLEHILIEKGVITILTSIEFEMLKQKVCSLI